MSLHIEFCLDEIDCEIEAALDNALDDIDRISLQRHVAGMRAIIAFARMRSAAHQTTLDVAEDDSTLVKGIGAAEHKILNDADVRWFAQDDTVATVEGQAETLSDIQTEMEADGSTSILASEQDCGAERAISAEITETPQSTAATEPIPDEPVDVALLPTAAVSAAPLEGEPQGDTVATVEGQTETLSDIQTEMEADGSTSILASEQDCGAERAISAEITETPQSTAATEPIPDEPVDVALLPTATVIPFETAINSRRQMSARPFRRISVAAAAVVLTILGVGFVAHQQLGDLPAMMVSSLHLPFE